MAYITFQPSDYFNTKLYTGSGSAQSLTGVGFQPDWIWIKNRSYADHHKVVDRVRWVSSSNSAQLSPNQNSAAGTQGIITSFDSDGFTLTTGDRGWNSSNGDNFVSWNWKANGAGSSNSDGSITSTVSANTTAGFSISTYTGNSTQGATLGHGLGVAPSMIILKSTTHTEDWAVTNVGLNSTNPWDYYMNLNSDGSKSQNNNRFGNVAPTSTVFTLGSSDEVNGSGKSYVAYCFAEKKGFSKFGGYSANGSTDGPFIYTGFKPAFVMIKAHSNNSTNWVMLDNKRSSSGGSNAMDKWLYANANDSEVDQSGNPTDFLSNGFKMRNNGAYLNGSGRSYIYMAFAEEPLVSSNNIPATAR
jgi:hypothetical protein